MAGFCYRSVFLSRCKCIHGDIDPSAAWQMNQLKPVQTCCCALSHTQAGTLEHRLKAFTLLKDACCIRSRSMPVAAARQTAHLLK